MKNKNSHYAEYIKERCGDGIVETKDGFATFKYVDNNIVYIQDIYVVPKKRNKGIAASLADKICQIAVKEGRNILLGSVDESARGADVSVAVLKGYGMTYYKTTGPIHFFVKQIAEIKPEKEENKNEEVVHIPSVEGVGSSFLEKAA